MNDKQLTDWQTFRTKGKYYFFLVNGILSYGLPMLIVMAFISKPFSAGFTLTAVIVHVITWLLAGLLFGISMWYLNEYRYHKALARRPANK